MLLNHDPQSHGLPRWWLAVLIFCLHHKQVGTEGRLKKKWYQNLFKFIDFFFWIFLKFIEIKYIILVCMHIEVYFASYPDFWGIGKV